MGSNQSSDSEGPFFENKNKNENKILAKYISQSIESKDPPLPVLLRISENGVLALMNYQMNQSNSNSLANSFQRIIPAVLRKLYLINSGLKDDQMEGIIKGLQDTQGLKTLGLM